MKTKIMQDYDFMLEKLDNYTFQGYIPASKVPEDLRAALMIPSSVENVDLDGEYSVKWTRDKSFYVVVDDVYLTYNGKTIRIGKFIDAFEIEQLIEERGDHAAWWAEVDPWGKA